MYFWLGLSLSLAALLTLNALASLAAAALWRLLAERSLEWRAQDRSRAIFALRVAPIAGATLFVALLLLPSYLTNEPYQTNESLSWLLMALALLSFIGLALAVWRGLAAWQATRRLVNVWLRQAAPVALAGIEIPAYRLRHPFPVVAVVGIFRPRLFVAEQLFTTLTPEELDAALRHELGHLATRDNLKRTLLRACSDVLTIVPCGRALDRAWAESAECAADEHAARRNALTSLNLASALVKIARLAPAGTNAALPIGAYLLHAAEDAASLAYRVRQLTRLATPDGVPAKPIFRFDLAVWTGLGGFLLLLIFAAWQTQVPATIHFLLERVVAVS